MIEVKNLTKRYGSKLALNDVSFTVKEGEILGFLGPNGAGKSTAMNIITGYLSATSGSVSIGGADVLEEPMAVRKMIGFLPEQPPLYTDMTVKEYLNFVYDLKSCSIPRKAHLNEICKIIKIQDVYNRVIKNLSKGYRQRVGIAQALIGNPEVLILDEPTVGLDPNQIKEIRTLIKKLGRRHTVILSSHILPEIQATCDQVIVISKGNIVANDTPENLLTTQDNIRNFIANVEGDKAAVEKLIKGIDGVKEVTNLGETEKGVYGYAISADADIDIKRILARTLQEKEFLMLGLKDSEVSLEDVFIKLTKNSGSKKKSVDKPKKSEDTDSEEQGGRN